MKYWKAYAIGLGFVLLVGAATTTPSQIWYTAAGGVRRFLASKLGDVVSVKDFGAVGDGVTDDTAAIQAAVAATIARAAPNGTQYGAELYFPRGKYLLKSPITINADGVELRGEGQRASMILCQLASATTDCITFAKSGGTVLGQNMAIRNISIEAATTNDARDLVSIQNWAFVHLENLDFFGAGRDSLALFQCVECGINTMYSLGSTRGGLHIGPLNAQPSAGVRGFNVHINGSSASPNFATGPAIWVEQGYGVTFDGLIIEYSGTTANPTTGTGILVDDGEVTLNHPYFEGVSGWDGRFGNTVNSYVTVINPSSRVGASGQKQTGSGFGSMVFDRVNGGGVMGGNLATVNPSIQFTINSLNCVLWGTQAVLASLSYDAGGGHTIHDYPGLIYIGDALGQLVTGKSRYKINGTSILSTATAIPSSGTAVRGDFKFNSAPGDGNPIGWIATAAGTPGTWRPAARLVSVSADRGDTDQTVQVGSDHVIQRWATALTANRTVTLSTTGALDGDSFRIVRTGLGAFTLNVGGLKTIPSATAAFVDVSYSGTVAAWVLTGYGIL